MVLRMDVFRKEAGGKCFPSTQDPRNSDLAILHLGQLSTGCRTDAVGWLLACLPDS